MPDSLAALDRFLLQVAKPRTVQRDGIHFQGLRYLSPTLASYVGVAMTIRYDPRDLDPPADPEDAATTIHDRMVSGSLALDCS